MQLGTNHPYWHVCIWSKSSLTLQLQLFSWRNGCWWWSSTSFLQATKTKLRKEAHVTRKSYNLFWNLRVSTKEALFGEKMSNQEAVETFLETFDRRPLSRTFCCIHETFHHVFHVERHPSRWIPLYSGGFSLIPYWVGSIQMDSIV